MMKKALDKTDPNTDSELRKAIALLHAHLPSSPVRDIDEAAHQAIETIDPLNQTSGMIYETAIRILFGQKPKQPKKTAKKLMSRQDMLSQILGE